MAFALASLEDACCLSLWVVWARIDVVWNVTGFVTAAVRVGMTGGERRCRCG